MGHVDSIQIFATGEGQTSPAGITGQIIASDTKQPLLPVAVSIGGVNALVFYSGSAPNAVSGLFQVDVVVPGSVTPGPSVPLVVTVGATQSQKTITIAVK